MVIGAEFHTIDVVPGTTLLSVRGEVDGQGVAAFREAFVAAERRARYGMIVVLDDARLWCATPYSIVLAAAARLGVADRGPLLVVCPNDSLASRVFRALDFEHRCVETVVAAMARLRCGGTSVAAIYAEGLLRAAVS